METVQLSGILASGRKWIVVESRKKCIAPPLGDHFILQVAGAEEAAETPEEQTEIWGLAPQLAQQLSPNGRWRIFLNGPSLMVRPHFHIHIVTVVDGVTPARLTDPMVILP